MAGAQLSHTYFSISHLVPEQRVSCLQPSNLLQLEHSVWQIVQRLLQIRMTAFQRLFLAEEVR